MTICMWFNNIEGYMKEYSNKLILIEMEKAQRIDRFKMNYGKIFNMIKVKPSMTIKPVRFSG